jgi:flagellin-like hook-associated protein FlgL
MHGIDTLGRLDADAGLLRLRLDALNRQLATGRRAEAPGDLSPHLPRVAELRAEAARRDTYGAAIGEALGRAQATQGALDRLSDIAREFGADVAAKLGAHDPASIPLAAERARAALVEVGHLLNTRHAGEYLFGGSDSANPPVPAPDGLPASGFAARIATAVAALGSGGGGGSAAAVGAATRAAAASDAPGTTPFSAFLSSGPGLAEPRRSVPAEDGALVPYGIAANRNAAAASTGETTGSWARDLLRGLAGIAALTPAQAAASPADFTAFAAVLRDGLRSATDALADEAGALGLAEARLEKAQRRHAEANTALRTQLAGIEEVDLAEVLTRLKATETTLQASYGAIGRLGDLTLARFLR